MVNGWENGEWVDHHLHFTTKKISPPLTCILKLYFGDTPPVLYCISPLYPACISPRILGIPLYPCICNDLYLAILQQIHCIPLYLCIRLYPAVSVRVRI